MKSFSSCPLKHTAISLWIIGDHLPQSVAFALLVLLMAAFYVLPWVSLVSFILISSEIVCQYVSLFFTLTLSPLPWPFLFCPLQFLKSLETEISCCGFCFPFTAFPGARQCWGCMCVYTHTDIWPHLIGNRFGLHTWHIGFSACLHPGLISLYPYFFHP